MADVSASEVEEWADQSAQAREAPVQQPEQPAEQARLYYDDVAEFVAAFLAPAYRRSLDGRTRTWCPAWWKHAEAISRLEALWRAWEYLRREPALGMSTWWRDHADPHMAVLLSAEGPFRHCDPEKGHTERMQALPLEQPPADLFTGQ